MSVHREKGDNLLWGKAEPGDSSPLENVGGGRGRSKTKHTSSQCFSWIQDFYCLVQFWIPVQTFAFWMILCGVVWMEWGVDELSLEIQDWEARSRRVVQQETPSPWEPGASVPHWFPLEACAPAQSFQENTFCMGGRTLHSGITQVSHKKNLQVLTAASWK